MSYSQYLRSQKVRVRLRLDDQERQWLIDGKGDVHPVDERYAATVIRGFRDLNEAARERALQNHLREFPVAWDAKISSLQQNAKTTRVYDSYGNERYYSNDELGMAARTFLSISQLFENPRPGYVILSHLLAGLHGSALTKEAPDIRFAIHINDRSEGITQIISTITNIVVNRKKWYGKKCRLKRSYIIDCRHSSTYVGKHIQDFCSVKIRFKKKKLYAPAKYTDTAACVIGADRTLLRELDPYMKNGCTFLVGCDSNEWGATRISAAEISSYDPKILSAIEDKSAEIAAMLHEWWRRDDTTWASGVIKWTKASFGKPDSRYIQVTLDPKKLRDALCFHVFLCFLDFAKRRGWISNEIVSHYLTGAKGVYYPESVEDKPVRRMEQPEVFEDIMRDLFTNPDIHILPFEERFVKAEKKNLGALRTISGIDYFVMPEERWKAAYLKAARKAGVDISLSKSEKWELTVLKAMSEAGLIKSPSSGYRYRYDLYGDGSRDKTYVVCVPIDVLDPDRNQVEST